jgi:diguanylate cyclase (GGDEF)-like protein/PAS domain S-box-containing protein
VLEPKRSPLADLSALRGVIDAVPHTIFIKDEEGRFVLVNQTMCALMGHRAEELIGKTDYDFVPSGQADVFRAMDRLVLDTGATNVNEEFLSDPAGVVRDVITRKNRLVLADGTRLIIGCITDITDFRRAEAQIRHNAEHDHLTGLANRSLFQAEAEKAIAASGRGSDSATALLLMDLDGFKNANDLFGHAVGDQLLVQTARFLSGLIAPGDLVARLGGDEFAIVQHAPPQPESAIGLAERVLAELSPMLACGHRVEISASLGIAPLDEAADYETLIRRADLALYDAKKSGRNTWRLFEPPMEAAHLAARFLEDDLRAGIERRQFSLAYQPFVAANDLGVLGFEVLSRWTHPLRGEIPPAQFIPLAERTGSIAALSEWVMREACAEAVRWRAPLRLSINVSPIHFLQGDLPGLVGAVAEETGIDLRRLDLEVTETAVIRDIAAARRLFDALRDLGVRIVLDDFGAGYSSLQILKALPFDKIKIDRSLMHGVGRNSEADAIITAILRLAQTLGLATIAEGVETEEQVAMLRREACHELQGYLFGVPGPIGAFSHIVGGTARRRA